MVSKRVDWQEMTKISDGSRFYRADLHVHTPLDKHSQYARELGFDPNTDKDRFAREFAQTCKEKGLEIVGLTEHNDILGYGEVIIKRCAEMGICVFPGFEVTVSSGKRGIHVLCLFGVGTELDFIDSVISSLKLVKGERFSPSGEVKSSPIQLEEVLEIIQTKHGTPILAHVDRDSGFFSETKGENRIHLWREGLFDAVEICCASDKLPQEIREILGNRNAAYQRFRPVGYVRASDARSLKAVGGEPLLLKLGDLTTEGLRQAFVDHEARIRFAEEESADYPRVLGLSIQGSYLDGVSIRFNKNLNAVIGGRGTGKSTLIEIIRHILECKAVTKEGQKQHDEIIKENFVRKGADATLWIQSKFSAGKRQRYRIELLAGNDPQVFNDETGDLVVDRPSNYLLPQIFGQREVLEIANNQEELYKVYSGFVESECEDLREKERALSDELESNLHELDDRSRSLARVREKLEALPRLEQELVNMKKIGISERLAEKRAYEREKGVLADVGRVFDVLLDRIEQWEEGVDTSVPELARAITDMSPNSALLEELGKGLAEVDGAIRSSLHAAKMKVQEVQGRLLGEDPSSAATRWQVAYRGQEERFAATVRELQREHPGLDPHKFVETQEQVQRLKPLKEEVERVEKAQGTIRQERAKLLNKLNRVRNDMSNIRAGKAAEINEELRGVIEITVVAMGNRDAAYARLLELRSGVKKETLRSLADHPFSWARFAEISRKGAGELSDTFKIAESSAQTLLKNLPREVLDRLEVEAIPDRVTIKLNVGSKETPNFRPLEKLSVGQRATAVLALLFRCSDAPLIVDQPEDDLDNRFIYEDIVQKLRSYKERRQFIIATHNANVPILGDAEQILILDADASGGTIKDRGSIDRTALHEPIKQILEGGEEAFRLRRIKYGLEAS